MISECVYYYPPGPVDYPELLKDALDEYDIGFPVYIFKRRGKFIQCYASVHYNSSALVFSVFHKLPIQRGVKRKLKQKTARMICQSFPPIVFVRREPRYKIIYSTKEVELPHSSVKINYPKEDEENVEDEENSEEDYQNDFLTEENDTVETIGNNSPPIPPLIPPRVKNPFIPPPPNQFEVKYNTTENNSQSEDSTNDNEEYCPYTSNTSNLNCFSHGDKPEEFHSFRNEIVERLMSSLGSVVGK